MYPDGKVKYHGLQNQGATCYLNSVLQVLFMTEDYRDAVKRHTNENPDTDFIDRHLTTLFDDLQERTAFTYKITRELGIDRVYEQRDAAEYFEKILSLTSPDASQIFHGRLTHRTICSTCGAETDSDGAFWHLPLALVDSYSESYSVVNGIKEYFKDADFSGDNQMYCDQCDDKSDATIKCVVKHHPEVLMLMLKRFEFNYSYMTYVKNNCTVEVPFTLEIPENQTYKLYAVVDHYGDLRSGHYTATIKSQNDDDDDDDGTWYTFNDARVNLSDYQSLQVDQFERSNSAYLLFYRKMNVHAEDTCTQDIREMSSPGDFPPAASDHNECQDSVKMEEIEESEECNEENMDLSYNPKEGHDEGQRDESKIIINEKEDVRGKAEADDKTKEREYLSEGLQNKQDEMSEEQRTLMDDGKTGDDEESGRKEKSRSKYPDRDAEYQDKAGIGDRAGDDKGIMSKADERYNEESSSSYERREKIIVNDKEDVRLNAEAIDEAKKRESLSRENPLEETVKDQDNDSRRQKTPDAHFDLKPTVSDRHVTQGHLNKQDEMIEEQGRVMDVKTNDDGKTGDDESLKKGKSRSKYPDKDSEYQGKVGLGDTGLNTNKNLGGSQKVEQHYGLKPLSTDKQGDAKSMKMVEKEEKTRAEERGKASEGRKFLKISDLYRGGVSETEESEVVEQVSSDFAVAVSISENVETGIKDSVYARGVRLPPNPYSNVESQNSKPSNSQEHNEEKTYSSYNPQDSHNERQRDEGKITINEKEDVRVDAEADDEAKKRENLSRGHPNKQDEMIEEQGRVMDVKTNDGKTRDDEESGRKGKSRTKYPDRDAEYQDKAGLGDRAGDDKRIVSKADERYNEESSRERRDDQGVKEQKRGNDKRTQGKVTSDSQHDCGRDESDRGLDDIKQKRLERKTSSTHTRQEDMSVVKPAGSAGGRGPEVNQEVGSAERTRRDYSQSKGTDKLKEHKVSKSHGSKKPTTWDIITEEETPIGPQTSTETKYKTTETFNTKKGNFKGKSDSILEGLRKLKPNRSGKHKTKGVARNAKGEIESNSALQKSSRKMEIESDTQEEADAKKDTDKKSSAHGRKRKGSPSSPFKKEENENHKKEKTTGCFSLFCKKPKMLEQTSESD